MKNLLLFAPLFFSGQISDKPVTDLILAFICFCFASSSGYILNDWLDRDRDQFHDEKKNRPISSGNISGVEAIMLSVVLVSVVVAICSLFQLSYDFILILCIYSGLTISYSFYAKHIVILELFSVSMGFVLRVLAGGAVSGIVISSWLFLTVLFISFLISVAKRLSEFEVLGEDVAVLHRQSQGGYTRAYLQHLLWGCGCITLVVYSLYVVEHDGVMIYSVLPASYGIFRFIYLTERGRGSDPIKALFSDRQLFLTAMFFLIYLALIIYVN